MNKSLLLALLIGGGVYLFAKRKSGDPTGETGDTAATDPDHQYFNQLSAVLESDPIWNEKTFPASFYEYVSEEYQQQQAGNPRTIEYNYGLPGAFMSIADAWKPVMNYSDATHRELWRLYSEYRNKLAVQNL